MIGEWNMLGLHHVGTVPNDVPCSGEWDWIAWEEENPCSGEDGERYLWDCIIWEDARKGQHRAGGDTNGNSLI